MRILLLYNSLYPATLGGVEHRNLGLALALAARGHRITLAGFGQPGEAPASGVDRLVLGPPPRLYDAGGVRRLSTAWPYAAAMRRLPLERFDLAETASLPFVHLPLLSRACRSRRLPLLVTWYECWGDYWRTYLRSGPLWRLYRAVEMRSIRYGERVVAISRLTGERVARSFGHRTAEIVALEESLQSGSQGFRRGLGAQPLLPLAH